MAKRILVQMARFSSLHPVNSVKKVIDSSGKTVIATNSDTVIANVSALAWVDGADANVPLGCKINAIFLSIFVWIDESTQAATPLIDWFIAKNPGSNLTLPNPGATGGNDNRRWVLHEEKGLSNDIGGGGTPMVFKGVIKIPPRIKRMGADDQIVVRIRTTSHVAYFCVKAIYKFFQ